MFTMLSLFMSAAGFHLGLPKIEPKALAANWMSRMSTLRSVFKSPVRTFEYLSY